MSIDTAPAPAPRPHSHRPLSRSAQAARSLWMADRLPEGSPEHAEAIRKHFAEFGSRASACAVDR